MGRRPSGIYSQKNRYVFLKNCLMIDVYEEYLTPDIAASRFLITLARKRQKSSFNGILQFINTTLSL